MLGKKIKKVMACVSAGLIMSTGLSFDSFEKFVPEMATNTISAYAASGRAYNQNDSKWKNYRYYKWAKNNNSLYTSGCMIFSFANAIYSLNGKWVDVPSVANWACNNGSFKPGAGGGAREPFYNKVASAYGNTYNFKIDGQYWGNVQNTKLINHLRNGGVAVAHVYNHFIAIVGYNSSNKTYHVIESAVWSGRGLSADSWVSASKLKSGKTNVDWFALISLKNKTSNSNNKTNTATTNSGCFKKYTGSSSSIVTALKSIGVDSSYNYRSKIAKANGISNYTGTASQNTTLLNKLKSGSLKKPGSTTTVATTKSYFKKYTGSSGSIVTALKSIGVDSSYNYRCKIAKANGISNYAGTASQNTTLLKKLKSGNLVKP